MRSVTPPCCVNLKALASRFFSTCFSRAASVRSVGGSAGIERDRELQALVLRQLAEGALELVAQLGERAPARR